MSREARIAAELRFELGLVSDVATDRELLELTEGTFLRARVELRLAWRDFTRELRVSAYGVAYEIDRLAARVIRRFR